MTFFDRFTEGVMGTPSARFYRQPKEKGGYRLIGEPNEPLLEIQNRLLAYLAKIAPRMPNATATKYGAGAVRNARRHVENKGTKFIFTLDLVNAFGSANGLLLTAHIARRTAQLLPRGSEIPNQNDWYQFLLKYALTKKGGLVQGYPTSPLLHDWLCEVLLDRPLRRYLHRLSQWGQKIVYSRYVDDFTFSSSQRITKAIRWSIRRHVAGAGYLENHRKTQVVELCFDGPVVVTGSFIDQAGRVGIPRKKLKEMERMLSFATLGQLTPEIEAVIEGKLRYLLDVVRGKDCLNALEIRTLRLYGTWRCQNGRDASWPTRILEVRPQQHFFPQQEKRIERIRPKEVRTKRRFNRYR